MYPIVAIRDDASEAPEQVGTKYKFWFDDHRHMFKLGRDGTGEHWAEKVACELCTLLGLPHAGYDFALWKLRLGTTTANFVPNDGRLMLGNELLQTFEPDYDGAQRYEARQHTVGRVIAALSANIRQPGEMPADITLSRAIDFFAGYLLLDAWIGNTDRHHENWGVVVVGDQILLAPTFDHASSLGRELSDEQRLSRLQSSDGRRNVSGYVSRAKSGFYGTEQDEHPLTTSDAFKEIRKEVPDGASYWLERLSAVSNDEIDAILSQVPPEVMSGRARAFVRAILIENQRRICSDE